MLARGLAFTAKAAKTNRIARGFAERTYGNLKDSDRIFTNLYRDGSPWIDGALKRVRTMMTLGRLVQN
jgi:hypothetical protein